MKALLLADDGTVIDSFAVREEGSQAQVHQEFSELANRHGYCDETGVHVPTRRVGLQSSHATAVYLGEDGR